MTEQDTRAAAIDMIEGAKPETIKAVLLGLLREGEESRTSTTGALAKALGLSIADLGYPVGMGLGPSDDHCAHAAAKITDRLLLCVAAEARQTEAAQ